MAHLQRSSGFPVLRLFATMQKWRLLQKETAEAEGFQTVPEEQSLGGDDFSFYMEKVPGCYIKIGIGKGATIHQPTFQVDPAALMPAVRYLSRMLLRWGEENA